MCLAVCDAELLFAYIYISLYSTSVCLVCAIVTIGWHEFFDTYSIDLIMNIRLPIESDFLETLLYIVTASSYCAWLDLVCSTCFSFI